MTKSKVSSPSTKIVNVVASSWTDSQLDIEKLALGLEKTIYEPDTFSGLTYFRSKKPKSSITLFASGRIVSAGTISEDAAIESLLGAAQDISRVMPKTISLSDVAIENVVATSDTHYKIDLGKLRKIFRDAEYDPKRFPAVILKIDGRKTLVFASGKLVSAGCKSEREVKTTIAKVYKSLQERSCFL